MQTPQPGSTERFTVQIDRDLEDIVPVFLANRKKDLLTIRSALAEQDYKTIQTLGHRMKGDGGGYGFDQITEIGSVMELAAAQRDHSAVEQYTAELEDFLSRVTVVYR
ncbi:MAG: Hpt domain-containing protein [Nitrospirae bacterium]|nr:Hpt domain-containing protein [Nitrospirota bacterium]